MNIPKGWEKVKLGELVTDIIDNRGKNPPYFVDKGIPVIDNFMIRNTPFVNLHEANRYIDNELYENFIRKHIHDEDILITLVGNGYGNVSLAPKERSVIIQNTIGLRFNNRETNIFLFYWLLANKEIIRSLDRGSVQPSIRVNDLLSINILLPPLPEQRAIASVLSSLDDKIGLLHRQNKTLEAMAETLFRKWFIEEAKEDWEEVRLGDIVDIKIGRTPPRKEFQWFSDSKSDVKWVSVKDLGENGVYIFDTSEYLTHEAINEFNIPIIPKNTVLLSFKMTVGRIGITTEPMVSNEAIAHFKFRENTPITTEYLYFFLKLFKYQGLGSTSTIVTSINSKMIRDFKIQIPDRDALLKFDLIAKMCFEKIKQNQQQIRTLENLRDTLLPKLMSGEVRVRI